MCSSTDELAVDVSECQNRCGRAVVGGRAKNVTSGGQSRLWFRPTPEAGPTPPAWGRPGLGRRAHELARRACNAYNRDQPVAAAPPPPVAGIARQCVACATRGAAEQTWGPGGCGRDAVQRRRDAVQRRARRRRQLRRALALLEMCVVQAQPRAVLSAVLSGGLAPRCRAWW